MTGKRNKLKIPILIILLYKTILEFGQIPPYRVCKIKISLLVSVKSRRAGNNLGCGIDKVHCVRCNWLLILLVGISTHTAIYLLTLEEYLTVVAGYLFLYKYGIKIFVKIGKIIIHF
jgi:hypothetical protein